MCLDTIVGRTAPTRKVVHGWKVFDRRADGLRGACFGGDEKPYPSNRWIRSSRGTIKDLQLTQRPFVPAYPVRRHPLWYPTGFHAFATELIPATFF